MVSGDTISGLSGPNDNTLVEVIGWFMPDSLDNVLNAVVDDLVTSYPSQPSHQSVLRTPQIER
jgi:hypothetical protein